MSTTTKTRHIGRNISRIRELRGMKQEALALALGISQQTISKIEQSETVEQSILEKVAAALEVSAEGISNFSDEGVINYFNTFNDNALSNSQGAFSNACTFNPLDKLVEVFEENKKLYERLLEAEQSKVVYLERLLKQ